MSAVCHLNLELRKPDFFTKGFGKGTKSTPDDRLRVMQKLAELLDAAKSAKKTFGWKETSLDEDLDSIRSSLVKYGNSHEKIISEDAESALSQLMLKEQARIEDRKNRLKGSLLQIWSGGTPSRGSSANPKPTSPEGKKKAPPPSQDPQISTSSAYPDSQRPTKAEDLDLKPLSRADTGGSGVSTARVTQLSGKKALVATNSQGKPEGWARKLKPTEAVGTSPTSTKKSGTVRPAKRRSSKPTKRRSSRGESSQKDEETQEEVVLEEPRDEPIPAQNIPQEVVDEDADDE